MPTRASRVGQGREPSALARRIAAATLGFALLLVFTWAGAVLQRIGLPLPGTVVGLMLFAVVMAIAEHEPLVLGRLRRMTTPVCRGLLTHMRLLFVPAGVGVITQVDLIRRQWAPIAATLTASTLMTLVVTGWLMHRLGRRTATQTAS